jgi:hypothetical protein
MVSSNRMKQSLCVPHVRNQCKVRAGDALMAFTPAAPFMKETPYAAAGSECYGIDQSSDMQCCRNLPDIDAHLTRCDAISPQYRDDKKPSKKNPAVMVPTMRLATAAENKEGEEKCNKEGTGCTWWVQSLVFAFVTNNSPVTTSHTHLHAFCNTLFSHSLCHQ